MTDHRQLFLDFDLLEDAVFKRTGDLRFGASRQQRRELFFWAFVTIRGRVDYREIPGTATPERKQHALYPGQ